jgi:hypothetical protein
MITQEAVMKTLVTLNVGDIFEMGELFHRLPADEKVLWSLTSITTKNKVPHYKFKLFYRGIFLRNETLYIKKGELERGH